MCFIFLVISFGLIINNIIKTVSPSKLKIDKDLVKFLEDGELPLFNKNLYLETEKQKVSYIISLVSISFSLFSLINYYLNNDFFWFLLIVLFFFFVYFRPFCQNSILSDFNMSFKKLHQHASNKKPTKREIEKRQKLIPIYLTILSILIALIKINGGNYSQDITSSIKTELGTNLESFNLLLAIINIIILNFNFMIMLFFLFIIFIIVYYSMLDQNVKKANIFGILASICFSIIFSIDLFLLTNITALLWKQVLLFCLMVVVMSYIIAYSLVWTNEKISLKWPVKEENSNINKKD